MRKATGLRPKERPAKLSGKTKTMRYEVTLPDLGDDTVSTATVSLWLADEGNIVTEDDDLVEMVTDKAAFTVPAPKTGTMVERLVEEDDEVSVGDVLCIIEI
jgi:pyruvate/2-oxoglutarate dehydrogenase complex dihydrolipoamide acyltransferase (E2) component